MRALLRALLRLHLSRSRALWLITAGLTLILGWGTLRVERALDLMSLLPTEHPEVRANLEAGVGQQELLWLVAEGNDADLEARRAWAEGLVDRLLTEGNLPLNGLAAEGRLSDPVPVPADAWRAGRVSRFDRRHPRHAHGMERHYIAGNIPI